MPRVDDEALYKRWQMLKFKKQNDMKTKRIEPTTNNDLDRTRWWELE